MPAPGPFVVSQLLDGRDAHKRWFRFRPGVIYDAKQVCRNFLIVDHPEKPGHDVYLVLPSAWHWKRVTFTPDTLDLSALFPL
jgi:hypothetical protein